MLEIILFYLVFIVENNDVASIIGFSLLLLPLGLSVLGIPVGMSFTIGVVVCIIGLITKD